MKLSAPIEAKGVALCCSAKTAALPVTLLMVSENEQAHVFVGNLLTRTNWKLYSQFSFEDATKLLESEEVAVILCDNDLSSGSWQSLLEITRNSPRPPRLVVYCRFADVPLWVDVLNLGAYDLLMYPFEAQELIRVIQLAWESWTREAPRNHHDGTPGHVANDSDAGKAERKPMTRAGKTDTGLRKAAGA